MFKKACEAKVEVGKEASDVYTYIRYLQGMHLPEMKELLPKVNCIDHGELILLASNVGFHLDHKRTLGEVVMYKQPDLPVADHLIVTDAK